MRRSDSCARRLTILLVAGSVVGACCIRLPEIQLGTAPGAAASVFGSGRRVDLVHDAQASKAARFSLRWRVGEGEEQLAEVRLAADPQDGRGERDLRIVAVNTGIPGESVLRIGPRRLPDFEVLTGDDRDAARREVVRYAMLFLDIARETHGYWNDLRQAARDFVGARRAEIISNLFSALDLALAAKNAMANDVNMQRFLEGTLEVDWDARVWEAGRIRVPVRLGAGRVDLMRGGFECVALDPADPASFGVRAFEGRLGDCQFRLDYQGEVSDQPSAVRDCDDARAFFDRSGRILAVRERVDGIGGVTEVRGGLASVRRLGSADAQDAWLVPIGSLRSTDREFPESSVVLHGDGIRFRAASRDERLSVWGHVPRGEWIVGSEDQPWRQVVMVDRGGEVARVWGGGPAGEAPAEVLLAPGGHRFAILDRPSAAGTPTRVSVLEIGASQTREVASLQAPPGSDLDLADWTARDDFLVRLGTGEVLRLSRDTGGDFLPFERVAWEDVPREQHHDVQARGCILRVSLDAGVFAEREVPDGEPIHRPGDPRFPFLVADADGTPRHLHLVDLAAGTQTSMELPPGTQWHAASGWIVHHDAASGRLQAMHRSMPQLGWQVETTAEEFVLGARLDVPGPAVGPWDPADRPDSTALLVVRDLQPEQPTPMFGMHSLGGDCRAEVWFRSESGFAAFEPDVSLRFAGLVSLESAGSLDAAARRLIRSVELRVDPRGSMVALDGIMAGRSQLQLVLQTRGGPVGILLPGMFGLRRVAGDPEWLVSSTRAFRLDACWRLLAASPDDDSWRVDFLGWAEPPEVVRWLPVSPAAPNGR